ncbi:MAG: RluA family pseudouridine synthase, partial [Lachnospiraceae bacterium]|nr:RluA family pseudouridine synthase [Lachnospiraceae bacterium]
SDETFATMQGNVAADPMYERLAKQSYPHIDVVFKNEDLIVLNKPAGILTQKAKPEDISLNDELLSYLIANHKLSATRFGMFKPSVANRLDRNTTGLVLAGKNLAGAQFLSEVLRSRDAKKTYHCVVCGRIEEEATMEAYLTKDPSSNTVRIHQVEHPGSKLIRTRFRPIRVGEDLTLLEVDLLTGRTHQIRAHMAYLGHPVLGDIKYGDAEMNRRYRDSHGVRRQMLHAYRIQLPGGIDCTAKDPEEFSKLF